MPKTAHYGFILLYINRKVVLGECFCEKWIKLNWKYQLLTLIKLLKVWKRKIILKRIDKMNDENSFTLIKHELCYTPTISFS